MKNKTILPNMIVCFFYLICIVQLQLSLTGLGAYMDGDF